LWIGGALRDVTIVHIMSLSTFSAEVLWKYLNKIQEYKLTVSKLKPLKNVGPAKSLSRT